MTCFVTSCKDKTDSHISTITVTGRYRRSLCRGHAPDFVRNLIAGRLFHTRKGAVPISAVVYERLADA